MKLTNFGLLFFTLAISCSAAWSQVKNFRYQSNIPEIDSSGVFRIEISPDLIAKSKQDLSDIRVADNDNKFIAYVLSRGLLLNYQAHFIEFPQVVSINKPDTATIYIAENKDLLPISKLWLELKKTDVSRTVNITGSDNLKDWFAIKENIPLVQAEQGPGTDYDQVLNFPNSNYRYFKIQVYGKSKTLVKIMRVGISTVGINQPVFAVLPAVEFIKKDTAKVSHLTIKFNEPYQINMIHVGISSPKYYNRKVVVYDIDENKENQLIDTTINSSGSQNLFLSAKTRRLRVDIFNEDDNALNVNTITAFQLKQYLISYLEKGKVYKIYTGDVSLNKPLYDLSFLNNVVYNRLTGISHSAVIRNTAYSTPGMPLAKDHTLLLWSSIVVALTLLSLLTARMVREIK